MKSIAPVMLAATLLGCASMPGAQAPADLAPKLSVMQVGKSEYFSSKPLTQSNYISAGADVRTKTDLRCGRDVGTLEARKCWLDVQVEHYGTTALDVLNASVPARGQRVVIPARIGEFSVNSCTGNSCRSTSYLTVDLERDLVASLVEESKDPAGELAYQLGQGEFQVIGRLPNTVIQAMAVRVAQP